MLKVAYSVRNPIQVSKGCSSHAERLDNSTNQGLCDNFPKDYFDFTTKGELDHSSSKNHQNVQNEAIKLMGTVLEDIHRQPQTPGK